MVFAYAAGGPHPYRAPCELVLRRAGRGELVGEASVDMIQELAHQRFRRTRDRAAAATAAREAAGIVAVLHELRLADVLAGMRLYERHPHLDSRDAVFAAVAIARGIDAILSTDRAFDDIPGLERIDPADEAAVDSLAA
jgi:predicted nucleic acid-binding protein